MLKSLHMIYENAKAGVELNGMVTNWFNIGVGVRQGDPLSPTLFGLYINDIVDNIKNNSVGVTCPEFSLQCLLFADDLVLISESESDLQKMFDSVSDWCCKWRMKVNVNKSKIVHYRVKNQRETEYVFKLAGDAVEKVSSYKYLGLMLDYSLDFNVTAKLLGDSGGRALGSMINKFNSNKGLGYKTFTKMYDMMVCPILDYCACIWGFRDFDCVNKIQNRAIRYYLGVHKFAPNVGIIGEMGWVTRDICRKVDMIKFWNRMIQTDDNRLVKRVFNWDRRLCKKNWSSEICNICNELNLSLNFENTAHINPKLVKQMLFTNFQNIWKRNVCVIPKLRFYAMFKSVYETEDYVIHTSNRCIRSVLAQTRLGILPLSIETGRYLDIPIEYRFCLYCDDDCVESEIHFLLFCKKYNNLRFKLYDSVRQFYPLFDFQEPEEQVKILMSQSVIKFTASYLHNAYQLRKNATFV